MEKEILLVGHIDFNREAEKSLSKNKIYPGGNGKDIHIDKSDYTDKEDMVLELQSLMEKYGVTKIDVAWDGLAILKIEKSKKQPK